ncbi:tetratricopeptide repeat protein [Candidatus Sumerlaeota bacterium]|nr:tetratricopeptide repeat protein [Candidatus Sumerlaeota bacterium]
MFREGLRLNPDSGPLHSALAQAFAKAGRTNDAIDEFGESLRLEPDNDIFHAGLAHLLFEKGEYLEASIHFKIVAKHNMGDPSALRWCAMSLIKLERWEEALEYVEAEARLKPGDEEVHNTLVSVQQSVERKKAAEKAAQERRDAERMK